VAGSGTSRRDCSSYAAPIGVEHHNVGAVTQVEHLTWRADMRAVSGGNPRQSIDRHARIVAIEYTKQIVGVLRVVVERASSGRSQSPKRLNPRCLGKAAKAGVVRSRVRAASVRPCGHAV
jgi:hypothetical protein